MNTKRERICIRSIQRKNTFRCLWMQIQKDIRSDDDQHNNEDAFFIEVPINQEFLVDIDNLCPFEIDFSNYTQISSDKINTRNVYDCFHGILAFIYYYSNNKLNTKELAFHFSGSKSFQNYSNSKSNGQSTPMNGSNILSIFDYEDISSVFQVKCIKNAFFGVTFNRIKILPLAYSIRSGANQNFNSHLISFTFEGYDEENQTWDILDERENNEGLISNGSFRLFFVKQNQKYYSSFKLVQTCPASNDIWGFSLAAFDIHGVPAYRENKNNETFIQTETNECLNQFDFSMLYDPSIDMTDLI